MITKMRRIAMTVLSYSIIFAFIAVPVFAIDMAVTGAEDTIKEKAVKMQPAVGPGPTIIVRDKNIVEREVQESGLVPIGEFKIYHYTGGTITATGTTPTVGRTIAVDPRVIPLGSIIVIDGKEYIAEDTGGMIKGNKIDMFVESEKVAIERGVRCVQVFIKK